MGGVVLLLFVFLLWYGGWAPVFGVFVFIHFWRVVVWEPLVWRFVRLGARVCGVLLGVVVVSLLCRGL